MIKWPENNPKNILLYMTKWWVFLLLLLIGFSAAKLPEITPEDVSKLLQDIMQAHATQKKLSPSLIKRAITAFIEQLDPLKCYLLEKESETWLNLNDDQLIAHCSQIEKGDFSLFATIHKKMVEAIHRRHILEKEIKSKKLFDRPSYKDFQKLEFCKSEEELKERLLLVKSLQFKAIEKIEGESRSKAYQRILKRKTSHEEDICNSSPLERERFILTYGLKALAASLDTHTAYFTPHEAAQFMIQVQARLFGIGIQLRDDITGFTVVKIIENGPAFLNGKLKENDLIIAINKEPVVGMEINDVVELIRGEKGTSVILTILRKTHGKEDALDVAITRDEVVIHESRMCTSKIPFGDGVIAHITLLSFYQDPTSSSASDIRDMITKIKNEEKLLGVILDLRHNSGGVLPQAVSVTGLFISKGIIVSVKDHQGHIESLRNVESKIAWDGPLLVLTSKASASAAEIVAQTLQDYGRAIIVGDEHTFGKGTFQTFTLDAENGKVNPKGEFKVTRGMYYTVSGKSPQLVGVKPDIVVSGILSKSDIGEQHMKFPLENDSIPPNFEDDLSDIPIMQREQARWFYRFNLQTRMKTYTEHLAKLKQNSLNRMQEDECYNHLLEKLALVDDEASLDGYIEADFQLRESMNIMRDLIVLSK